MVRNSNPVILLSAIFTLACLFLPNIKRYLDIYNISGQSFFIILNNIRIWAIFSFFSLFIDSKFEDIINKKKYLSNSNRNK